jgi:quinol monooxygenase YgiN
LRTVTSRAPSIVVSALLVVRAAVIRSRFSKERREVLVGKITNFARMGVKPEKVEKLTALAVEACKVAADEPGTLTYDWHYSEEHGSLVLLETYANSSAHLSHMQAHGHGELMGSLMALIESLEFFVLGEPTAEHAEALASVTGAQFYSELASK